MVHVLPHVRSLGGTERAVLDLVTSPELADLRQEVAFVRLSPPGPFPSSRIAYSPTTRLSLPLQAAIAVARRRPKVIHGWLLPGNLTAALAKRLSPNSTLITSERNVGHALTPLKRMLERYVAHVEDISTANSEAVRASAISRIHGRAARMRVILPGIAVPERPAAVSPTTAVMVGRLHPVKDHLTALRAWREVCQVWPGAHLTVVGDGPERRRLQRSADDLKLTDGTVTFVGDVDPMPFLFGAELYLSTSRAEGFSRSLLEALMAGVPAVVTDVGGIADLPLGVVRAVPPGDAAAVAAAILSVREDAEAASRGAMIASAVAEQYSLSRCVLAYRELYRTAGVT